MTLAPAGRLLAALILVATSAPGRADELAKLDRAASCCRSIVEFAAADLPVGRIVDVTIDESTDAFDFAEGRSRFVAFDLAPSDRPRSIDLVVGSGAFLIPTTRVWVPTLLFLDADSVPIRQPGVSTLQPRALFDGMAFASFNWSGRIPVPDGARRVVIFSDRRVVGRRISEIDATSRRIPDPLDGRTVVLGRTLNNADLTANTVGRLKLRLVETDVGGAKAPM